MLGHPREREQPGPRRGGAEVAVGGNTEPLLARARGVHGLRPADAVGADTDRLLHDPGQGGGRGAGHDAQRDPRWDERTAPGGRRAAGDALGVPEAEFPVTALPGFPAPAVEGHGGTIRSYRFGEKRALVFLGRTHYYEGRGVAAVAHGVRTAVSAGCGTVVLTNGCGGLREGMRPGQPVLISDHLNLTAASPIVGANFVDLTDLYSPRLRAMAREIDPSLEEGVYAGLPGPHFETPAEIRMLRTMGADLVGMSTVLEAIAARAAGAEIVREPAETFWGGYSAAFTDPDGHPWEVAHNPRWTIREDGSVELPTS